MISAERHLRPELKHEIDKKALSATTFAHALTKIEDDYFTKYLFASRKMMHDILCTKTLPQHIATVLAGFEALHGDDKALVEQTSQQFVNLLTPTTWKLQHEKVDKIARQQSLDAALRAELESEQTSDVAAAIDKALSQPRARDQSIEDLCTRICTTIVADRMATMQTRLETMTKKANGRLAPVKQAPPSSETDTQAKIDRENKQNQQTKREAVTKRKKQQQLAAARNKQKKQEKKQKGKVPPNDQTDEPPTKRQRGNQAWWH